MYRKAIGEDSKGIRVIWGTSLNAIHPPLFFFYSLVAGIVMSKPSAFYVIILRALYEVYRNSQRSRDYFSSVISEVDGAIRKHIRWLKKGLRLGQMESRPSFLKGDLPS